MAKRSTYSPGIRSFEPHGPAAATHSAGHHIPASVYFKGFAALFVLLVLTLVAARIDLGPLNFPIALGIAVTKALIVVLFFMGVKYGTKLTWLWAGIGFAWLLLLFGFMMDYSAREWIPVRGWEPLEYDPSRW